MLSGICCIWSQRWLVGCASCHVQCCIFEDISPQLLWGTSRWCPTSRICHGLCLPRVSTLMSAFSDAISGHLCTSAFDKRLLSLHQCKSWLVHIHWSCLDISLGKRNSEMNEFLRYAMGQFWQFTHYGVTNSRCHTSFSGSYWFSNPEKCVYSLWVVLVPPV